MGVIEFDNRRVELDRRGYLVRGSDWDQSVASCMAHRDGIELSAAHWEILWFLRAYYDEFKTAPPMRLLVKAIAARVGEAQSDSRYLYRLFPEGPAKQACRYAGLPKPVSCI